MTRIYFALSHEFACTCDVIFLGYWSIIYSEETCGQTFSEYEVVRERCYDPHKHYIFIHKCPEMYTQDMSFYDFHENDIINMAVLGAWMLDFDLILVTSENKIFQDVEITNIVSRFEICRD